MSGPDEPGRRSGGRRSYRRPLRPPRRDLGAAAMPKSGSTPALAPLTAWRRMDEFTIEAIEFAGLVAETAVQPFLRARREPAFTGVSAVELRFLDTPTLLSFRRTQTVRPISREPGWRLVRRWADAGRDGGLDEAMCTAVAAYLNSNFEGLLEANVYTVVLRP